MTRDKTKRMTVKVIESLPGPPDDAKTSNIEYSVVQESNLCLAVYKNGSRSWRFKKKMWGKRLFMTIGPYPLWSLDQAIEKTRVYKRMIADGIDPRIGDKIDTDVLFADFIKDDFLPYALKHYKTFRNQQNMLEKRLLKEFGRVSLREVNKRQIVLFHQRVCDETSGTTGNRYLSLLSAIFKYAIAMDLVERNPCSGVKKAKENKSRDRFLQEDEYVRFIQVLYNMLDHPHAQVIFLLIATGMRKSEVMGLKWSEVNLYDCQAYLPDPKNGESRYVALNSVAIELLTKMKEDHRGNSPWVFPAQSTTGHVVDIRKTFDRVCQLAKIKGLRIHDLRRSHASHLLNSGVDVMTIKELLGHRSLKSTQIYARVATSSLAKSSELAAEKIQRVINQ